MTPKRSIKRVPQQKNVNKDIARKGSLKDDVIERLCENVKYECSPQHKTTFRHRGVRPARNSTKSPCDLVPKLDLSEEQARELLIAGIRRCMVDVTFLKGKDGEYPKHIWAVHDDQPFEATRTNDREPKYHGYPLFGEDAFTRDLNRKWSKRQ